MSVCCECCVLSGRGLCDELITRSKESYRLWCVVACDLETSRMRRPWLALGGSTTRDGDRLVYIGVYLKSVLIYINNYPTRCNTKQSIYYSVSFTLHVSGVNHTHHQEYTKLNYRLRYWSYFLCRYLHPTWPACTKNMTSTGVCSYSFVYSWWWVWLTPETCRVNLQNNK